MLEYSMEDRIAELCFKKYSELGKNGKPRDSEWTLLAGFVVERSDNVLQLASLATGIKCIGKSKMSSTGSILNDCHAEILSRRGFLRYLYENIETASKGDNSQLFNLTDSGKYCLIPGIKFHFFCSHVPCGDASIIPMLKRKYRSDDSSVLNVKKSKTHENQGSREDENVRCSDNGSVVFEDIHRTGGKCINAVDPYGPGTMYHTVGAVRTKPGRGEPTLSLSCSDKIAKWIYCGLQGALLSLLLLDRINLDSVIIGGGGQFCIKAMERALFDRCNPKYRPIIKQTTLVFEHSRYISGRDYPCATSIIWADLKNKPLEVSVDGKRLGTTKKSTDSSSRLKVSKMELFNTFINLTGEQYRGMTYSHVKSKSILYYKAFGEFKRNIGSWSSKPPLLDFVAET